VYELKKTQQKSYMAKKTAIKQQISKKLGRNLGYC